MQRDTGLRRPETGAKQAEKQGQKGAKIGKIPISKMPRNGPRIDSERGLPEKV